MAVLKLKHLLELSVVAVVSGLVHCAVNEAATTGTKCLKDEALKDYPVNVYYCDDNQYPVCCQRDYSYDCCEDEGKKNWREQLILWGCVTAGIVLIIVICLFFWKEDLLESCCKKCRGKRAKKYNDKTPLQASDDVQQKTPLPDSAFVNSAVTGTPSDSGRGSAASDVSAARVPRVKNP